MKMLTRAGSMKLTLLAVLGLAAMSSVGCSTPVYSGRERAQQITRNWGLEAQMMQDDIDHALLLRPVTTLSPWNIR